VNRRNLLKALAPVGLTPLDVVAAEMEPGRRYLVFVDTACVDHAAVCGVVDSGALDDLSVAFIAVTPPPGGTLADAVLVYEMADGPQA
jgi:hypothetical protein